MQRTQIYLSDEDLALLDQEADRTGLNRSRLIRDAISRAYGHRLDPDAFDRVLRESAGAWTDRPFSGAEYKDAIRGRRPGGLAGLWPEGYGPPERRRRDADARR